MLSAHHAVEIARSPDAVFAYLADFSNDPSWRANVLEMRPLGGDGDLGGRWSRQIEVRQVPGRVVETEAVITSCEPGIVLAVQRASGPVRPEARYEIEALGESVTRVHFRLEVRLRGLAWLLWPAVMLGLAVVVRPSLRGDFERLRANLEAASQ